MVHKLRSHRPSVEGPFIPQHRTSSRSSRNVENVPKSGYEQLQQRSPLFDDFVGAGEEHWRNFDAESACGLKIDDEFELRGLQDWKF